MIRMKEQKFSNIIVRISLSIKFLKRNKIMREGTHIKLSR